MSQRPCRDQARDSQQLGPVVSEYAEKGHLGPLCYWNGGRERIETSPFVLHGK